MDPEAVSSRRECPGVLLSVRPTAKGPECGLGDGCAVRGLRGRALLDTHAAKQTVNRHPEWLIEVAALAQELHGRRSPS